MKRSLMVAVLTALVTAAVLAPFGFSASSKSGSGKKSSGAGSTTQKQSGPPPTMKEALAAQQKRHAERDAKLAKALDVTTEKLKAAQDAVMKKHLDQAVKDNNLTEAQRDAILACKAAPLTCDRSNLPAHGFRGGLGHGGGPGFGRHGAGASTFAKDLAAELGIAEDKVTAALDAARPERSGRHGGGMGRGGHGPHGGGMGFGPPPHMGGASGQATEQAPATAA